MQKARVGMWVKWILCVPLLLLFGCASFELTSVPSADIYENEEKIATTPYRFKLLSGGRALTLKRSGYVEEEVFVSSLDPKSLHFELEWVGRTRIDTFPHGADVIRASDGVKLGVSPCGLRLAVPETILIKKTGYDSEELDLTPNQRYVIELNPTGGFQSAFYKKIGFSSDQGKIEIYDRVAGERIGITPVQLTIEAGTEIEYRLVGYRPRLMLISKKAPHRIHIELEAITTVTLTGPPGAQVYRAGGLERLGEVPFTVEVDSSTMFELKKEGYYDSSIAVAPGSPNNLAVELKKIPYKTIVTTPAGAEIYRIGGLEKLGESPFTTIVNEERIFEIKKKGFRTSVIGMGSGSPEQLNVPLTVAPRDDPDAAALGTLDSPVISTY